MIDDIRGRKINSQDGESSLPRQVPRNLTPDLNPTPVSAQQQPARPIPIKVYSDTISSPKPVVVDRAPAPEQSTLPPEAAVKPARKPNIFSKYWRHKLWTLPLTLLAIAAMIMAVPTSRYMVLAYFVSEPFTVTVTDSASNTPISGASVKLDGQSATTDSSGKATIKVPVGNRALSISKTYYRSNAQTVFVDLSAKSNTLLLHLVATGRQVPLKVINKITGKAIPEAEFTIGATTARTNLAGLATVVLPADSPTQSATIHADGYTDLAATIQITTKTVETNTFSMVPTGRVYFLSNQSGNIDVVSTNLDGSGRKTVLAGTGSEDASNTVLLASRDWKYLALVSKRDSAANAKLFLINTSTNALTTIDDSTADFTAVGWSGHYFVYTIDRSDLDSWQPGQQSVVSYNADTKSAKTLVKSQATGTNSVDAQYQNIVYPTLFGSNLVYTTTWYQYPADIHVAGQADTMVSIKLDGSGSRTLKSVDAGTSYIDSVNLASPGQLYFAVYGTTPNYYRLDSNDNITQSSTITSSTVSQVYPTYVLSPSGIETLWTTTSGGKSTLLVGDSDGASGSQLSGVADYAPYGWFGDSYLLVQKGDDELYIVSALGGTPLKISDYLASSPSISASGRSYGSL